MVGERLDALLRREAPLSDARAGALMRALVAAVAACHAGGIVHGDVRPENVVVAPQPDASWSVKLAGFTRAQMMDKEEAAARGAPPDVSSLPGTAIFYAAPESLQGDLTPACDWWGCGVIYHYALSGSLPFSPINMSPDGAYPDGRHDWDRPPLDLYDDEAADASAELTARYDMTADVRGPSVVNVAHRELAAFSQRRRLTTHRSAEGMAALIHHAPLSLCGGVWAAVCADAKLVVRRLLTKEPRFRMTHEQLATFLKKPPFVPPPPPPAVLPPGPADAATAARRASVVPPLVLPSVQLFRPSRYSDGPTGLPTDRSTDFPLSPSITSRRIDRSWTGPRPPPSLLSMSSSELAGRERELRQSLRLAREALAETLASPKPSPRRKAPKATARAPVGSKSRRRSIAILRAAAAAAATEPGKPPPHMRFPDILPTIMPAACPWTSRSCAGSTALHNVAVGMGLAVSFGGGKGGGAPPQQLEHLIRRASLDYD